MSWQAGAEQFPGRGQACQTRLFAADGLGQGLSPGPGGLTPDLRLGSVFVTPGRLTGLLVAVALGDHQGRPDHLGGGDGDAGIQSKGGSDGAAHGRVGGGGMGRF